MQSLSTLVSSYSGLFGKSSGGVSSDSAWFVRKWGWLSTVDNLVNGDVNKYSYVYEMPVIEFLNILAFVKDKQKLEREQQDKLKGRV